MDEPSEGLSPRLVIHIGEIRSGCATYGIAVMLVEQNLSLALSVADDIYVLSAAGWCSTGRRTNWRGTPPRSIIISVSVARICNESVDLKGLVAVVTGGNGGIGLGRRAASQKPAPPSWSPAATRTRTRPRCPS